MIRPGDDSVIYLYRHAVDMRKSINDLVAIVEGEMEMDPFSSALFVFWNTNEILLWNKVAKTFAQSTE
ncbi:MAG: transposase [Gammaproteobacteria bacterium]|nr:transposase [Gammaproteobacteria bacterium]